MCHTYTERGVIGDGHMINHNIHVSLVNLEAEFVAPIRPPVRREFWCRRILGDKRIAPAARAAD